jgi:ribosome-binding factor A
MDARKATMLADEIRDHLALWITREHPGSFIGVSQVTLAPNMRKALVWLTVPDDKVMLFKQIEKNTKHYQHLLVTTMTRYKVPRIEFAIQAEFPEM